MTKIKADDFKVLKDITNKGLIQHLTNIKNGALIPSIVQRIRKGINIALIQAKQQAYEQGKIDGLNLRKDYNDIKPKIFKNERKKVRKEMKKEIQNLIVEEILIAQKEGIATSRLTSLAMKLTNLNN